MNCTTCEHPMEEHEPTGCHDDHGDELWECGVKGCRCEIWELSE